MVIPDWLKSIINPNAVLFFFTPSLKPVSYTHLDVYKRQDLDYARRFAEGIHAKFPGKMLAYNCSPSFNWAAKLSVAEMETFREELAKMGYKFQFITLAGFHALNTAMFELALAYKERGMAGYSELQEREFALQAKGFRAVKHQSFVGTGYFDAVQTTVTAGNSSTTALAGSTEAEQFH